MTNNAHMMFKRNQVQGQLSCMGLRAFPVSGAGQWGIPTFEILLARSGFLVVFALVGCAVQRQNPLGKRCAPLCPTCLAPLALTSSVQDAWSASTVASCISVTHSRRKNICVVCRRGLLLIRGIFGFGAIGNYLFAVSLLPLNDTLVLTFTAPIWAAILGPFLINEKPTK